MMSWKSGRKTQPEMVIEWAVAHGEPFATADVGAKFDEIGNPSSVISKLAKDGMIEATSDGKWIAVCRDDADEESVSDRWVVSVEVDPREALRRLSTSELLAELVRRDGSSSAID